MNKFVVFSMAAFAVSALARPVLSDNVPTPQTLRSELHYHCTAHTAKADLAADVTLDTGSLLLTVDMDDVRVRGYVSETVDKQAATAYYFLQGGSAPAAQRFTLAVKDAGKWARFSQAFGAQEFVCEQ